ncbi:DsrE family protein [Frigidibacter sp. RF13]|uniref:DsrE family protein n=1 Tax=Frigidibacter sp. RF13 TaxID=2997340 RepID=UPI00226DE6CA|nr:DsrE family protein [Frigidibacter sp. RF13]MCY1126526.1 DsrE family protein [Frigidibacter sp. RF13]
MKFLIHITTGYENPSKAALGFLIAKTAAEEGHEVTLFLAADASVLVRSAVAENLVGIGTGALKSHLEALSAKGVPIFVSGLSAKSRGMTAPDEALVPVQFALPPELVRLTAEADRVLCY